MHNSTMSIATIVFIQ